MQYPVVAGDPLAMEWGEDEEDHFPPPPAETSSQVIMNGDAPPVPGVKCIALYAYAVSTILSNSQLLLNKNKLKLVLR